MSLVMYSESETEVTLLINYSAKTILLIKKESVEYQCFPKSCKLYIQYRRCVQ